VETALAILSASLVAGGIYLLLSQNLVRMLFGLVMLSNAMNMMIFSAGRLEHQHPPLIAAGQTAPTTAMANALPQALILTAIVIGFALQIFMLILFYRSYETLGTADTQKMRDAEPPVKDPGKTAQAAKEGHG
jgi:multicomponent Na+:H+ antiporter subunit C